MEFYLSNETLVRSKFKNITIGNKMSVWFNRYPYDIKTIEMDSSITCVSFLTEEEAVYGTYNGEVYIFIWDAHCTAHYRNSAFVKIFWFEGKNLSNVNFLLTITY